MSLFKKNETIKCVQRREDEGRGVRQIRPQWGVAIWQQPLNLFHWVSFVSHYFKIGHLWLPLSVL